ncbi:MAG: V4R domain-containing protein [Thermoplasmatota archaeon]
MNLPGLALASAASAAPSFIDRAFAALVAAADLVAAAVPPPATWASAVSPAALFLVGGGVAALAILLPSVFARGAALGDPATESSGRAAPPPRRVETAPGRTPSRADGPPETAANADEAFRRGKAVGVRIAAADVDELVGRLAEAGLGEVRVLRALDNLWLVDVRACRGCAGASRDLASKEQGCPFESGLLEGAFGELLGGPITAREAACGRLGPTGCEFERWR